MIEANFLFFGFIPSWVEDALFLAVRLSVWGVALALANVILARRWNQFRRWMIAADHFGARRWLPMPKVAWPEIRQSSEGWFILTGLALAFAPLFSFTLPIMHEQLALLAQGRWPIMSVIGMHCLLAAETHYLRKLAFFPDFKMKWIAGWYIFSTLVGFAQVVLAR
tara:strand:- start:33562 stop:34059 length:498 start_codon:yes stop_codon:yes gene_type:complete